MPALSMPSGGDGIFFCSCWCLDGLVHPQRHGDGEKLSTLLRTPEATLLTLSYLAMEQIFVPGIGGRGKGGGGVIVKGYCVLSSHIFLTPVYTFR